MTLGKNETNLEFRRNPRITCSPKRKDFYHLTKDLNIYSIGIINTSDQGLGGFYVGDADLKKGLVLRTMELVNYTVRWIIQMTEDSFWIGLQSTAKFLESSYESFSRKRSLVM